MEKAWIQRVKVSIVHLLFWSFWLMVPILFSVADGRPTRPLSPGFWLRMLFAMVFFYLNYLWLVERLLFRRRLLVFILLNLVLLSAVVAIEWWRHESGFAMQPQDHPYDRPKPPPFIMLSGMLFSYVFAISMAIALRATTRWFKLDAQRKALENEHLKSVLSNLKMQLNPHFFFNTLNNIYSLIQLDQEQAQAAVHRLARLMRYHLYETNAEMVPLGGEMEFLDSYVSLMRMRSTALLDVDFYQNIEDSNRLIAPLLLVPLVENAFKFGVSSDHACSIRIKVVEKKGVFNAHIKNSVFVDHDRSFGNGGEGIGLSNLRKRLELIYSGRYEIVDKQDSGYFNIDLSIRL